MTSLSDKGIMSGTNKKQVLVVTGSRAEYGLLRSTMDAIKNHPSLSLVLVVTGMHTLTEYGDTATEITADGYRIDCLIPVELASQFQMFSEEVIGIGKYCSTNRPDVILVLGDRDEAFAGAVVAAHLNIPLAHIHGGDISGPGVDELLRHAITKFAHLHFPGSSQSAARIRALGEESWRVKEYGSVAMDVFAAPLQNREMIAQTLNLATSRPWIVVLQHPTIFDDVPIEKQLLPTLTAIEAFPDHEKILLYPNNDSGSDVFIHQIETRSGDRYHRFASIPRLQFLSLLKESDVLIGNSSSALIELSQTGTPAVNIGNRQKGRERGDGVLDASYEVSRIINTIHKALELKKTQKGEPFSSPYGMSGVGKRVAAAIAELISDERLLQKQIP
jgi:UDP-N-acetylglucosamine 2-epimerase (non-hydrolysing)/GDP/UDP-N,N'-diacetylbacillosamine 2-epimerase (hydrolysing)